MGDLRPLDDLRGSLEDGIRVFPHEPVHVDARMQLEDARFIVGVLPDLLQGVPSALLRRLALVQARLGIPASEEHDALRPFSADRPNRPDIARERILLQVEEKLLERIRPAPRRADEFSLWEQEVLGREVPSVLASISRAPLKRLQPSSLV